MGIPYLKYIPPFSFIYNSIKRNMDIFKGYMSKLVMDQKENHDDMNLRSTHSAFTNGLLVLTNWRFV